MAKKPPIPEPSFGSAWLKSLHQAILKRRRAIRHQAGSFERRRDVETSDGVEFERLELDLVSTRGRVSFRFWEDLSAWICVFRDTKKGRLKRVVHCELWDLGPKDVVARLEASLLASPEDPDALREIWKTARR